MYIYIYIYIVVPGVVSHHSDHASLHLYLCCGPAINDMIGSMRLINYYMFVVYMYIYIYIYMFI